MKDDIDKDAAIETMRKVVNQQARDWRDRKKRLSEMAQELAWSRAELIHLAETLGMEEDDEPMLNWHYLLGLQDTDPVDDIKELSIDGQVPFFSEAYLYELVGKEDARTILAMMRQVVSMIDETKATGF